jgi:hypothetical protein
MLIFTAPVVTLVLASAGSRSSRGTAATRRSALDARADAARRRHAGWHFLAGRRPSTAGPKLAGDDAVSRDRRPGTRSIGSRQPSRASCALPARGARS